MDLQTEIKDLGLDANEEALQKYKWLRETWTEVGLAESDDDWFFAIRTARKA
jgi:hypothetical protein